MPVSYYFVSCTCLEVTREILCKNYDGNVKERDPDCQTVIMFIK